jgi:FkbM family methyltransferase
MVRLKAFAQSMLSSAMRGRNGGLSPVGRAVERLASYVQFVARDARREVRFAAAAPLTTRRAYPPDSLIYDVGANNGDDTEYYLKQGFRVVAVEANPELASAIASRFPEALAAGRLVVASLAVVGDERRSIDFWINTRNQLVSTAVKPAADDNRFHPVSVEARRISALIAAHGEPLFVKIDVEGLDQDILADLFTAGLRPPYLSAEAHSIEPLCQMVGAGYRHFKTVAGRYVHRPHFERAARTWDGAALDHAFPPGSSSGPWGEDIPGPWLTADETFAYLAEHGLGWKDIHAAWRPMEAC